ncbi:metal ABC transporter permease [Paracoccus sp. NGMCC 1.201697]|uniref:Metal ABC transporter permease n=1 Tax=Paracoccus broussonetiae subsp. drimophilus TaxID=3373869 RepID=A0ABW7LJK4_9RHOB
MFEFLISPFLEFDFMRRAQAGALLLAVSAGPVGMFLMLRRMSLTGDAMAHAILPGAAAGFLLFGLDILPMTIGGLIAGAVVALGAGAVARFTVQKEDAAMAAFYLVSLSLGVVMVSLRGSSVDLMHVLFGTVLVLNNDALWLIVIVAAITIISVTLLWRALIAECLDLLFLRSVSNMGPWVHLAFLGLAVMNLVAGFQALGTPLSVGLMILSAAAARFWMHSILPLVLLSVAIGALASFAGLLLSYHVSLPSGPAIILSAGAIYALSLPLAPRGALLPQALAPPAPADLTKSKDISLENPAYLCPDRHHTGFHPDPDPGRGAQGRRNLLDHRRFRPAGRWRSDRSEGAGPAGFRHPCL